MRLSGGQQFERRLRELAALVSKPATLRVGFLENATYPPNPGNPGAAGTPVAMIAAIQDFGAPRAGIPPRPFFRNMIAAKSREWGPAIGQLLIDNGYDAFRALDLAGQAIAGQLKESIIRTNSPPLAPSTVRKKGFSKPLIDTSHLINSIDHEVVAT